MSKAEPLTREVEQYCKEIGIDLVGFADPRFFERFQVHNQPYFYLNDSKAVIILGLHIYDIILDAWNQNKESGKNHQFADSILENYCYQVKKFLSERGYISAIIPYTPGLFLKDSAALAGIGPIGKNNLLITEKFGSQVRLRALTTNAPLICGKPIKESKYCEGCEKCINACPANAFVQGKYNKFACHEYQLSHLRMLSEDTSIWCNLCIEACPIGKKM